MFNYVHPYTSRLDREVMIQHQRRFLRLNYIAYKIRLDKGVVVNLKLQHDTGWCGVRRHSGHSGSCTSWVMGNLSQRVRLMAEYQTLIVAAVSALFSGIGVGVTLKTDVKWLRLMMEKLDARLTKTGAKIKSCFLKRSLAFNCFCSRSKYWINYPHRMKTSY